MVIPNSLLTLGRTRNLILPTLLDGFSHALAILLAILLVQIRGFDVGRRGCVGIIQQTGIALVISDTCNHSTTPLTSECWSR